MADEPEEFCNCGASLDDVTLAHLLSCGEDALVDADEAVQVADNIVAAIERQL